MKKWIIGLTGLFILMGYNLNAQEVRGEIALGFDISKKLDAEIQFQTCNANVPEPFVKNTFKGKVDYSLTKRWKLSGSYAYSFYAREPEKLDGAGEETGEKQKFAIDLSYQPKRFDNDVKLSNRLRYQYSTAAHDHPKDYLRNKTTLDYKFSETMDPYIAIEPYLNLHSGKITYFRVYIGNELTVWNTKVDLYYIAETRLKKQDFGIQYIVGVCFNLNHKDTLKRFGKKRNLH